MRPSRSLSSRWPILLTAGCLAIGPASLPGCGGGLPNTGTEAAPVNPEVAADQNKAMQEYYASKGKGPMAKKGAR